VVDGTPRVVEHSGDEWLQVILGIDNVAERRVVHAQEDGGRLTERLAADRARVLERNRVALLRHDAAALHEAFTQPQVPEFRRAPEQQVLDEAAETCQ